MVKVSFKHNKKYKLTFSISWYHLVFCVVFTDIMRYTGTKICKIRNFKPLWVKLACSNFRVITVSEYLGFSRYQHFCYNKPAHEIQIRRTNCVRTCVPWTNHCILSWETF